MLNISEANSEDEIYSIMFSSLKHPARRRILRMLSLKDMAFSEMLEELGISSSSLTYHIESLGELLTKKDGGAYRLSAFGEATVNTMRTVEESSSQSKRHPSLGTKWKVVLVTFLVGIVLLSSVSVIQMNSINGLSTSYDQLKSEYQRLLSWNIDSDRSIVLLQSVFEVDITRYHAALISNTLEYRQNLGGIAEKIVKYSLTNNESKFDVVFRFRNNTLSKYQLYLLDDSPNYIKHQSDNVLVSAKGVLQRLSQNEVNDYLLEMISMLDLVTEIQTMEITKGNIKLRIVNTGSIQEITWLHTQDGVDFSAKSLSLKYENNILMELTDGWSLFTIGSAHVNISSEEAVEIARESLASYTYTEDETLVSNLQAEEQEVNVVFAPMPREEPLKLIPYWYVTLDLIKEYPGGINRVSIGIWGDTGEVMHIIRSSA